MPKGTRKTKNVSTDKVFGRQAYFVGEAGSRPEVSSKERARITIGDKGMAKLNKAPSSERVVDSKGGSYITPKGKKKLAAAKKVQAVAKTAAKKAAKAVKSAPAKKTNGRK